MRIPLSWLREYVAIDVPTDELAARLAISTCEVERIAYRGVPDVDGNLDRFRVGRVLDVPSHPNADRVRLCQVDVGERRAAADRLRCVELRGRRDGLRRAARRRSCPAGCRSRSGPCAASAPTG